jgi:hypothetical protein
MDTVYKISYVIQGGQHPGAIVNSEIRPKVGARVQLGERAYVILDVVDLMPARGSFEYLHVTLKPAED